MRSTYIAVACTLGLFSGACSGETPSLESSATPQAPSPASAPGSAPAPAVATGSSAAAGQTAQVPAIPQMAAAPDSALPASPDSAPAVGAPQPGADFCGVLGVMKADCQACHAATPIAGAPMPLMTYEDFMKPAPSAPTRKVHELVKERTHDTKRPMPPTGVLAQDKLSVLDAWLQSGALQPTAACPVGETEAAPGGETSAVWPPADCEDVYEIRAHDLMDPTKPYTVAGSSEEHPRISYDAPWGDDDVQLLATRPITENPELIHHWILWDSLEGKNLTFWAPGAGGDELPSDVGLYMPKGPASLGLDMHYFNMNSPEPKQDASGLEMCITRTFRPKTAAIYGLRGNASVPPLQRVANATPCTATTMGEVHFLGITPHMHRLGVHARLDLQRGTEPMNVIYDGAYHFEAQTLKALDNVAVKNGDVLTTTCTYENDTDRSIVWGDSTQDEMCFNWMRYYPKGAFNCVPAGAGGAPGRTPGIPGFPGQ
jgi:hypothetical protein